VEVDVTYLNEGEVLALPCRWCFSLSIRLRIKVGTFTRACPKCGELTHIAVRRGPGSLELRTGGVLEVPENEADDREQGRR